jgi:hypothetical protein
VRNAPFRIQCRRQRHGSGSSSGFNRIRAGRHRHATLAPYLGNHRIEAGLEGRIHPRGLGFHAGTPAAQRGVLENLPGLIELGDVHGLAHDARILRVQMQANTAPGTRQYPQGLAHHTHDLTGIRTQLATHQLARHGHGEGEQLILQLGVQLLPRKAPGRQGPAAGLHLARQRILCPALRPSSRPLR